RIYTSLEGFDADAADSIDEAFTLLALREIHAQNPIDRLCGFSVRHGRTDNLTERRVGAARGTADRDLIPLLAALIDAEDPDVADVVVPACIHAAGHLELDIAEIVEIVEIIESLVDLLRNRDRPCVRECAEVETGTANHV